MKNLILKAYVKLSQIKANTKGQDLIEYSLMAGFVALAAGAVFPNVASNISTIFSKVSQSLSAAANNGQ